MQHLALPDCNSLTYPNKFDKNNFNDETFFLLNNKQLRLQ